MKRLVSLTIRSGWIGLLISFSLILAACSPSAVASTPSGAIPVTGGGTVQPANNAELGQILVTSDGKTLYTNTVDTPEALKCTNIACTSFWAPYIVDTEPTASGEIPGSLGTVIRPDGSKQVTYNQQPLYTFYLDKQQGDAKGNGFTDFGGTWHVVSLGSQPGGSNSDSSSGSGGYQYP